MNNLSTIFPRFGGFADKWEKQNLWYNKSMMTHLRNIYLTGLPGSGKTTVAGIMARLAGSQWAHRSGSGYRATRRDVDTGDLCAGEAAFRAIESDLLAEFAAGDHQVIATGGGAILAAANREIMHASGVVVALDVTPSIAAERLGAVDAEERPLLRGDLLQRLQELSAQRAPLYAESDLLIATDQQTPDAVARAITAGLVARGLFPASSSPSFNTTAFLGPRIATASQSAGISWDPWQLAC